MNRLSCAVIVALLSGCASRAARVESRLGSGVVVACADSHSPAALSFGQDLEVWVRKTVTDTGEAAERKRVGFNLPATTPDKVRLVADGEICRRAAMAYANGRELPAGRYAIVVVQAGERFVAINMNAIEKAGEFLTEAVLDRSFHVLAWLAT